MDEEPQMDAEFIHNSTTDNPGSASYGNGMFTGSHHFTVIGQNFTNITNNYPTAPALPSDFRMIPMGDIDLQHDTGVIGRHREWGRPRVRRVYSAKVEGRSSSVTVAVYQGHGAEEEWRQDIARYMTVRHPNIIQVYGGASSGNIHATVFHDDLIPVKHFMDLYRHSHFLEVYVYAYCNMDFRAVRDYFDSTFEQALDCYDCTFWIRRSTGRLCTDLIPPDSKFTTFFYGLPSLENYLPDPQGIFSLRGPNTESAVIESLTLEQYHEICFWELEKARPIYSSSAVIKVGAVLFCPSSNRLEDSIEIATLPNAEIKLVPWTLPMGSTNGVLGEVTEDGWMRFNSGNVPSINILPIWYADREGWPSQANHVFNRVGITSNFEECVFVRGIVFTVEISTSADDPPLGYLFLCPAKDFQEGPSSFWWPDDPAYWSRDPSGTERLTMNEATALGFPSIQFYSQILGVNWDSSVYAGLRQFHQAKGFDPESQDLARHLGYLLYQLSSEAESPFAYVDEEDSYSEEVQDLIYLDGSEDARSSASEEDG